MGDGGADQSQAVPQGGGGYVGAQDHRPDDYWQCVGEHMLQRMSVDGDDSDGSSPLMVLFVEMLVEAGMVEQSVRIVKQKFLQDGEDSQLCQGPVEGGQLRATWVRSPGRQVVSRHYHGPRDAYPVEEDSLHCIAQLNGIHRVILVHLDTVASDEGGFASSIHQ